MTKILFIGDIVGETGLAYLEAHLPELIRSVEADFVVANAENLDLTPSRGGCGMTPPSLRRLFATGIDLVTGGNHSFDAPDHSVHDDVRVLRPLNYAPGMPGRGAGVIEKNGLRLGVINLPAARRSPTSMTRTRRWKRNRGVDRDRRGRYVFIDFHSESVMEKLAPPMRWRGARWGGRHAHARSHLRHADPAGRDGLCERRGMTGPGGGLQGYHEAQFIDAIRRGVHPGAPQRLAPGPIELGAVVITVENGCAVAIERVSQVA